MKPEIKTFEVKLEDASQSKAEGIIRGLASTFGNIDLGDDVVDAGAFKKTLQESKGLIPILADHDPAKQIGWNMRAEETKDGLYVEGKINLETQLGKERYSLAKQALELGAKTGLSIGYAAIKAIADKERPMVRRLKEVKLFEYSLVTFPMNTEAMVTAAKAWTDCKTHEDFAAKIILEAKERGLTVAALCEALQHKVGAARHIENEVDSDPALISQSLDKLLNIITQKGN
jgi:HK97 family phage prohead protease